MPAVCRRRVLFIIAHFPRTRISVKSITSGQEALSGTHSSTLLVAEGLSRRGWEVGLLTYDEVQIADTGIKIFRDAVDVLPWLGKGLSIWSFYGDGGLMAQLRASGIRPVVWSHIDLSREISLWLSQGSIAGVITVSDFSRLALLHHPLFCRIGRIYNPLNPFFSDNLQAQPGPRCALQAIFAGHVGESKGAHRVLQFWRGVRQALPESKLVIAGSAKLYSQRNRLGPLGISDEVFEERYIVPLIQEFGSLENSGVHFTGLLTPVELKKLYKASTLGIINLNWDNSGETFSCAAVEMIASGLRVFSVASGALPETIGKTGNATLVKKPGQIPEAFVAALGNSNDLKYAVSAQQMVRERYGLGTILDNWEELLLSAPEHYHCLAGSWQFSRSLSYFVRSAARHLCLGGALDRLVGLQRRLFAICQ